MEDPTTPAGWFALISDWLSAAAAFAFDNLGITLFLAWCVVLFVATESAKPFVGRLLTKGSEDYVLVLESMPTVLGLITGYWVFPAIMGTTQVTDHVPGWSGLGMGAGAGFFTSKAYAMTKNKKFIRLTKVFVQWVISVTPFLNRILTPENQKYIEEGTQKAGRGEMVTITDEMVAKHKEEQNLEEKPLE